MRNKISVIILSLFFTSVLFAQSIEVISYGENPLEVSPLLGTNLTVNYKYNSEPGSAGNHIYIGLEILDANNTYQSTVAEVTLNNQPVGNNTQNSTNFFISSIYTLSENLPIGYYYQVKAILYASGSWEENASAGHWNTPALILQDTSGFRFNENVISKGADISWMTEMESKGYVWKDNNGTIKELIPLLKEYDLDAVRLRVWVNPENSDANGWCDIEDLVQKAILAKASNMDILLCIHYSDHWADPGKQTKPAAWTNFTVAQLETAVENHTTAILSALKAKGIVPKWVQIGNETSDGMLWPTGRASAGGFENYAKFINAGTSSVKIFDDSIKTILHLAGGNDNDVFKWNINGLISNGLVTSRLDILGMSLYPDTSNWKTLVDETYANMLDLKTRFNKDVMMAEVGFDSNAPDIGYQFLTYMIEKTKQANGLGVFYWEPIAHGNFTNYSKGAWDSDGSPSITMDAFIDNVTLNVDEVENRLNESFTVFPNPSADSITVSAINRTLKSIKIYNETGKLIKKMKLKGHSKTLDVSNLKIGIYMIRINDEKSIMFLKK